MAELDLSAATTAFVGAGSGVDGTGAAGVVTAGALKLRWCPLSAVLRQAVAATSATILIATATPQSHANLRSVIAGLVVEGLDGALSGALASISTTGICEEDGENTGV